MNTQSLVRVTLGLSCIFNLGAAYLIAFPSSYMGQVFELPQNVPPLYAGLLSFVVLMFGVIYGWLARQTDIDQPLLFVGGFGKVCFFSLITITWLLGNASGKFAILGTGDLVFGTIWLMWLFSNRTHTNAQQNS